MITKEDVEDSITYKVTGALMMAAGLLSDAQELLSVGANPLLGIIEVLSSLA